MLKDNSKLPYLLISLFSILLFVPYLGAVHLFDWDEINFAESAREMLVTGNFRSVMVNYEPFWEKPPLFFWLQALSMKVFGVNEFAARFPNVLVGLTSLNILYYFGNKLVSNKLAFAWVLLYAASISPHFYFHSGIIDPLFNLFIFLSVIQLYRAKEKATTAAWMLAGLFLGLAVLTKGPAAGLIVLLLLGVIWVRNGFRFWFKWHHVIVFSIITLGITSIWFLPEVIQNGTGFLSNFLSYQIDLMKNPVASHGQPWFYHPLVLLVGCFPASILFLKRFTNDTNNDFESWAKVLFWVVLILFSIVTTKIVHYSSLCYFPLTFLAAQRLVAWRDGDSLTTFEKVAFGAVGGLWMILFIALPIVGLNMSSLIAKYPEAIKDTFTLQNLSVDARWNTIHLIIGIIGALLIGVLLRSLVKNNRLITCYLLGGFVVYLSIFIATVVPRVEQYTQASIIDFYKSLEGEDVYVDVYKYKSYAHYFYSKVQPLNDDDLLVQKRAYKLNSMGVTNRLELNEAQRKEYMNYEMDWFISGDIDKPVYLIAQPRKAHELQENPNFELIQNTGGYWVFKRQPLLIEN